PTLGTAMSVVIFGMIFNTALGMFYALGKRLTRSRPERFRGVYVATVLVGFVLSFVGFRTLVSYVYPALGYMVLVLIVVLGAGWLNRAGRPLAGALRGLSMRRLALRRLGPAATRPPPMPPSCSACPTNPTCPTRSCTPSSWTAPRPP